MNIYTKKTGAGHYLVEVEKDFEFIGKFKTTDMQLIDDIHEMQKEGFESNLVMHDNFEDVKETVLKLARRND